MHLTDEIKQTIREALAWYRGTAIDDAETTRIDRARAAIELEDGTGEEVPGNVQYASAVLGGIVPGNTITREDYECLSTVRKWISQQIQACRTPAPQPTQEDDR